MTLTLREEIILRSLTAEELYAIEEFSAIRCENGCLLYSNVASCNRCEKQRYQEIKEQAFKKYLEKNRLRKQRSNK
jgi:hypothetical protein